MKKKQKNKKNTWKTIAHFVCNYKESKARKKKSTHTQHQQIQIVHYTILLVGVSIVRDFFFHHRLHLNHLVNCMRCFCQHIFINTISYCWILIIYRCWLCVASSFWSLLSFFLCSVGFLVMICIHRYTFSASFIFECASFVTQIRQCKTTTTTKKWG